MTDKPCKDCEFGTKRPAPHPGPRCATHHRAFRKAQKQAQAARRRARVYGLTPEQHDALLGAQGGLCAICGKPSRIRALAVDHDHTTGEIRGLLCRRDNHELLGHYDVDTLIRAARYLLAPPAFEVIGRVVVPSDAQQIEGWTADE